MDIYNENDNINHAASANEEPIEMTENDLRDSDKTKVNLKVLRQRKT